MATPPESLASDSLLPRNLEDSPQLTTFPKTILIDKLHYLNGLYRFVCTCVIFLDRIRLVRIPGSEDEDTHVRMSFVYVSVFRTWSDQREVKLRLWLVR